MTAPQDVRHTPGPWHVQSSPFVFGFGPATNYEIVTEAVREFDGEDREFHIAIASIHNSDVDSVYRAEGWGENASADEAEANASLIACAPELLDVAHMALGFIHGRTDEPANVLRDSLRAAINKALGK